MTVRGVFPTKEHERAAHDTTITVYSTVWSEIVWPSMIWWDDATDMRGTPQVAGKTPQLR